MEAVSLAPEDIDLRVYPYFLKFFQGRTPITIDDFVIAANFTYGWMPTMLELRGKDPDWITAAGILNRAREERIESTESLDFLSRVINNSLVGASKLLHFVSPSRHAIWDSRVFYYLNSKDANGYQMRNIRNYLRYTAICDEIIAWREFPEAAQRFQEHLGQQCTPLRVVELTMWAKGVRN